MPEKIENTNSLSAQMVHGSTLPQALTWVQVPKNYPFPNTLSRTILNNIPKYLVLRAFGTHL